MSNESARILVIDDEPQMCRLLRVSLQAYGFEVEESKCGREGIGKVLVFKPDLVILDMGLPDMDGLDVIKELRGWSPIPIIILSVIDQEHVKIDALDSGANDYVTKPFNMGELLARIRAALRQTPASLEDPVLIFDNLIVDLAHRLVSVEGRPIKLTPTEYEILKIMAINRGKVLTQKELLRSIWGPGFEKEVHYLRVYVGQLRQKIEADPSRPQHIITESGVGFRFM